MAVTQGDWHAGKSSRKQTYPAIDTTVRGDYIRLHSAKESRHFDGVEQLRLLLKTNRLRFDILPGEAALDFAFVRSQEHDSMPAASHPSRFLKGANLLSAPPFGRFAMHDRQF